MKTYYQQHKKSEQARARKYYYEHKEEMQKKHREYCRKNKDKMNKLQKEWRLKNTDAQKEKIKKQGAVYRKNNREKIRESGRKYAEKNKERTRAYIRQLKIDVLNAYGGICQCCGENTIEFLQIDHINNNGFEERKKYGNGTNFYCWLRKHNYPDNGYQVLCANCNVGKRMNNGICPHKRLKIKAS